MEISPKGASGATNSISRSASVATSARALSGSGREGITNNLDLCRDQMPATKPSTRKVGVNCTTRHDLPAILVADDPGAEGVVGEDIVVPRKEPDGSRQVAVCEC